MRKLVSLMMLMVILLSFSISTYATPALSIENNNTVRDLGNLNKEQINYLIDSTTDYATITQYLDAEYLFNFAIRVKNKNPKKTENDIDRILKEEVLKIGYDLEIFKLDGMGNMVLYRDDEVQPYSYGDLPIIRNKLGPNEKKVFNESLFKGLGVLSAGKFAMDNYERYYNSSVDDNGDAFRHGVWMAYSAFNSGADYARRFGIAHEDDFPNTALDRKMDLYNNDQGIQISKKIYGNTPPDIVPDIVLGLVDKGVKNGDFRRFRGPDIGILTYLVKTNSKGARK